MNTIGRTTDRRTPTISSYLNRRLLPALSRGLKQFFREHLPKIEMEAEKLERFKRTLLSDKELYVAFSDVQMRYKYVSLLPGISKFLVVTVDVLLGRS